MYVPGVIERLAEALGSLNEGSYVTIDFRPPEGGFLKLHKTSTGRYSLELSGNDTLLIPFTKKAIRFLEISMGWKFDTKTSNYKLSLSKNVSDDELLGIVLWSLECSFKDHIRRPMDPDYWPNLEEAEEMYRRSFGRRHQEKIEKKLSK